MPNPTDLDYLIDGYMPAPAPTEEQLQQQRTRGRSGSREGPRSSRKTPRAGAQDCWQSSNALSRQHRTVAHWLLTARLRHRKPERIDSHGAAAADLRAGERAL